MIQSSITATLLSSVRICKMFRASLSTDEKVTIRVDDGIEELTRHYLSISCPKSKIDIYCQYVELLKLEFKCLKLTGKLVDGCGARGRRDMRADSLYDFPLHKVVYEATRKLRPWTDVDLMIKNMPKCIARVALMANDGKVIEPLFLDGTPIHLVAACRDSPRVTLKLMLEISPKSAEIFSHRKQLPIFYAASGFNYEAVELLSKIFPRGLLCKVMGKGLSAKSLIDINDCIIDQVQTASMRYMLRGVIMHRGNENFNDCDLISNKGECKVYHPFLNIFLEAVEGKCSFETAIEFLREVSSNVSVAGVFEATVNLNGIVLEEIWNIKKHAPCIPPSLCLRYCHALESMTKIEAFDVLDVYIRKVFGPSLAVMIYENLFDLQFGKHKV